MSTHEERAAAEAAVRKMLAGGPEARLLEIPGVYHVSVGAKERAGQLVRELCIRVYVRTKQPLESIALRDRIPREIEGVQTDVNVVQSVKPLADFGFHRPVEGGIAITNKIPRLDRSQLPNHVYGFNVGTFGCTATRRSGGKPVLLTNAHVLMVDHLDQEKHLIFQPGSGKAVKNAPPPGPKDKEMIARVVDSKYTEKVDAGIAELDVSSCCRCCCGLEVKDEILGLTAGLGDPFIGPPTKDHIIGMRRPAVLDVVFKVGSASGWSRGFVADPSGPVPNYNVGFDWPTLDLVDQILIMSDKPAIWPSFLVEGDSGSAVIDEQGFIVGLGFGHEKQITNTSKSFANNIVNVCDALKITINLTADPSKIAGRRIAPPAFDAAGMMDEEAYAAARERVLAHPMAQHVLAQPAGAWLFALGEAHRDEVVRLVTTHRPVTVVWHRAGGPALFAKGLEAFREDRDELPVPAHGTLESALAQVGNALAAHGSPALRDAIAAHREELLGAVRDSVTVDDVLRKLAPAVLSEA